MTEDESTEMESDLDDWSTYDLGIIILMVVVIIFVLYNFFSNIGWMQFTERSIIIVPAIIGLMLQPNFYLKRTALKIIAATSPIIKRMTLNNNITIDSVVSNTALSVINLIIQRMYSSSVAVITLFNPLMTFSITATLESVLNLPMESRITGATLLTILILTVSSNQYSMSRSLNSGLIHLGTIMMLVTFFMTKVNIEQIVILTAANSILIFYHIFYGLRSHKIVHTAVGLSIAIFTHDLLLSFIEIPNIVYLLLDNLLLLITHFVMLSYQISYTFDQEDS